VDVNGQPFTKDIVFSEIVADVADGDILWGDYDQDGDLDILIQDDTLLSGNSISSVYVNENELINNLPSVPTGLSSSVTGNEMILSWTGSTDLETPVAGLSFNLRVGTAPGLGDVMPANAYSNGQRLVPDFGNVNYNKSWRLTDISPGVYYWTVQAVDNQLDGSLFADEQSFEIFTTGILDDPLNIKSNKHFVNAYPNPFNNRITFELQTILKPKYTVYISNANGMIVRNLSNSRLMGKDHLIVWDGRNDKGNLIADGIYYFVVQSENSMDAHKVVLIN
jgi:hypothetical protein